MRLEKETTYSQFIVSNSHKVICTYNLNEMGRQSVFKQVLTWVKIASIDRTIQKRKFYSAHELFDIYVAYCTAHSKDYNPIRNNAQIRGFTGVINKIANTNVQIKSKYNKNDGYSYIFVDNHEIDMNVNSIRVSNRKKQVLLSALPLSAAETVTASPPSLPSTFGVSLAQSPLPITVSATLPITVSPHSTFTPPATFTASLPSTFTAQQISLYIKDSTLSGLDTNSPIVISLHLPALYHSLSHLLTVQFNFQETHNDNTSEQVDNSADSNFQETHNDNISEQVDNSEDSIAKKLRNEHKMDSPEALYFFLGKNRAKEKICTSNIDDSKDMLISHINSQVETLQSVNLFTNGWKTIVSKDTIYEEFTDYQISALRHRATYLAMVYYLCIDHYNTCSDFTDIIQMAIERVNSVHLSDFLPKSQRRTTYIVNSKTTILRWFREYREQDYFTSFVASSKKEKLPPILNANPDLVSGIIHFCRSNINSLSVELVHDFLITKAIPELVNIVNKEQNTDECTIGSLMSVFGLQKLCIRTVQIWMNRLGFQYEPRRKTYYVDTHDTPANIKYRSAFINRYFQYELLAHRWYSITIEERNRLVKNGQIRQDQGYKYEKEDKVYFEFHVDDCQEFQDNCERVQFGGYLSVRKPKNKKKLMIIGQDEVIMKQFIFSTLAWTLPDGSRPLIPKDEGMGLMISAFTSRELGFAYTIPSDILEKVNKKRKTQKYSDEQAATVLFGSAKKQPLTITPFLRQLEYGQNKEGYWTYDHMVVQLEDCIDVLKVQFPEFDFVFLVDHSNGHDRLQPDGLNINKISVRYGGKQPKMRDTKLTSSSLFGPYHTS